MQEINDLFKAEAASPLGTVMLYGSKIGFVIPEYQRQYDWSEGDIKRLYYDTVNGFYGVAKGEDASAFTFLGTLILVEATTKEGTFKGTSVAIVDGQQRLTTLTLFACALTEALREQWRITELPRKLGRKVKEWLEAEVSEIEACLYACAVGSQQVSPTKTFPFPRIIRGADDHRGRNAHEAEYRSPIGNFLDGFAKYFDSDDTVYAPPPPRLGMETYAKKLEENFEILRNLVSGLNDPNWYDDSECEQFKIEWIDYAPCRKLFGQLFDYIDKEERNNAIREVMDCKELHELIRLLLFSAYFCNCIVLTRVTTQHESAAFDIFDALNTTGQPLTALETLKPRVINFENSRGAYAESDSESYFKDIEKHIDKRFARTEDKQAQTKELIVTFALFLAGMKLPLDLAAQRNFLRRYYADAVNAGDASARFFVRSLSEIATFRRFYWEKSGIEELSRFHGIENLDTAQLLTSVIGNTRTSLALPILARYWSPTLKHDGDGDFISVLKAIVAFLILRRAATGGTAGIDSDFRAVMAPRTGRGASRKFGLCAGVRPSNPSLTVAELKQALKKLLLRKLKKIEKTQWVDRVAANPLYNDSRAIVRFIILCAAHKAKSSNNQPGCWTRSDYRPGPDTSNFLNYRTWIGKHYATVEHVAPKEEPEEGGYKGIYRDNIIRHSLGNLILLPEVENAAIGNSGWRKKRMYYRALSTESRKEQEHRIQEAEAARIQFSERTRSLLSKGECLSLLSPLCDVPEWDGKIVALRSRNIAELCWDVIWDWLN